MAHSEHVFSECVKKIRCHDTQENLSAINDLDPDRQDVAASGAQPVHMHVGIRSRLQQLIIRPGENGGVLTRSEFEISRFCAEEKLKKKHPIVFLLCSRE